MPTNANRSHDRAQWRAAGTVIRCSPGLSMWSGPQIQRRIGNVRLLHDAIFSTSVYWESSQRAVKFAYIRTNTHTRAPTERHAPWGTKCQPLMPKGAPAPQLFFHNF